MSNVLTPQTVGHYTTGVGHTGSSSYTPNVSIQSGISNAANALASQIAQANSNHANSLASQIAGIAGSDLGDYADYIRQALTLSQQNTAQSQQFAREQMSYQQQSDANAMAWSASEADKNRQWQERLSNQAHQREVQDLIAAGLNPILSANNGAYTGSGATGQAFSSSGAQGMVDTSASGIMGSIANAVINTASQAAIAEMYNDTSRYTADMQYAASKMAAETSIYNEHSRNEANKIMTAMNNQADIAQAQIHGNATVSAAGAAAAAQRYYADKSSAASMYNTTLNTSAERYKANKQYELGKYQADTKNMLTNPVGYVAGVGQILDSWLKENKGNANPAWNIHINDYE